MKDLEAWHPDPPAPIRGRVQLVHTTWAEQHELRAELREMKQRGEIATAWGWRCSRKHDYAIAYVDRLREPTPAWRWWLGGGILATGALVGIGAMLWHSRLIWLTLAGVAGFCFLVKHIATGSSGCHCPLCGLRLH